MSGATCWTPAMATPMNSSKGSPSTSSAPYTSSRLTPGANDRSFSFFLTEDTFMAMPSSGGCASMTAFGSTV
jgi:hypothetical protein